MDLGRTLSITEARKKIFQITDKVRKDKAHFTLTERGTPKAIIMSVEEFESWIESLEATQDFPELEKDIEAAERDFDRGRYVTLEEVLAQEGFILADKPRKRHASSRSKPKSRKRSKEN